MVTKLVVHVDENGAARVSRQVPGGIATFVGEVPAIEWPLSEEDLRDLRWYLESYLSAPYAVYQERGERIADSLDGWGRAVFETLFADGPVRDAYVDARAHGPLEVVLQCSSPAALGLPWELMRDPAHPTPLTLDGVAITRSLPQQGIPSAFEVEGTVLRLLMVISRPAGTQDVAYQMVARPLVRLLGAVQGRVEMHVLRPPTLDALRQELQEAAEAGRPYQVVHFDGHGALHRPAPTDEVASGVFRTGGESGVLVFEKPTGGDDPVPIEHVAQVLAAGQVPVVILNACQSGAVGKDLEAAVATRLMAHGTQAVVAMAYSVYATAAAEFMAAFYEQLFAGAPIRDAVAAGRSRMALRNTRPSPKGPLPLQDWLIPVHYKRRDVAFPHLERVPTRGESLDSRLDRLWETTQEPAAEQIADPLTAAEEFIGRDDLFYRLDVGLRHHHVVVLHGPGGTGKTELAKAFARWWRDTGGVEDPQLIVWQSFEPGVKTFGLDGVVNSIGSQLLGTRFYALDAAQREAIVRQSLNQERLLLIWDNVESAVSMPDPSQATPPLDAHERSRLAAFLTHAATSRSTVILTSRSQETWLADTPLRVAVGGLSPEEANAYADQLLAPHPDAWPKRRVRAFADLMDRLDGHPLSMRLTLPRLATSTAQHVLDRLDSIPAPSADVDLDLATRNTSLYASLTYSYRHLDEATARLLLPVSLFQGVVDADVLAVMSSMDDVPAGFASVTTGDWARVLDQAADVGLLTPLGLGMYRIHPALPGFLAHGWSSAKSVDTDRAATQHALCLAHAWFGTWLLGQIETGNAGLAFTLMGAQLRTFSVQLQYAIATQRWLEATSMLAPLNEYLEARGLSVEADQWAAAVQRATETPPGTPPDLGTDAGALWLVAVGHRSMRQVNAGLLREAYDTYNTCLQAIEALPEGEWKRSQLAVTTHQLGQIAKARGDFGQAETLYKQSLALEEGLSNRRGIAESSWALGSLALDIGEPDRAERWVNQSLAIREELGDLPGIAKSIYLTGRVALARGDLGAANPAFMRSLAIFEQVGDRPRAAQVLHILGVVAEGRGDWDEAEQRYRQALAIREELGDGRSAADTYNNLGNLAAERGDLGEAERWYLKCLAVAEAMGETGDARVKANIAALKVELDRPAEALTWMVRAVAQFDTFPHPSIDTAPATIAALTQRLGEPFLATIWQQVTGRPIPPGVSDAVRAALEPNGHEQEDGGQS